MTAQVNQAPETFPIPVDQNAPSFTSLSAGVYALLSQIVILAQEAQQADLKGTQAGIEARQAAQNDMASTGYQSANWSFWSKMAEGGFALLGGLTSIGGAVWSNSSTSELSGQREAVQNELNTLKNNYGDAFNKLRDPANLIVNDANALAQARTNMNREVGDLSSGIFHTSRSFDATEKSVIADQLDLLNPEQFAQAKRSYDQQVSDLTARDNSLSNQVTQKSTYNNMLVDFAKQGLQAGSAFASGPLQQLAQEQQVASQLYGSLDGTSNSGIQQAQQAVDAMAKMAEQTIQMMNSAYSAA